MQRALLQGDLAMRSTNARAAAASRGAAFLAVLIAIAALAVAPAWSAPDMRMTPQDLDRFDGAKRLASLSDGVTLAYLELGPRGAQPVVLIHGYTDSARDWAPIAPILARRFHLIIVDLRGHGASAKPDCCYTRFDFAYDIKLLLDALRLDRADVVGHSLGSLVAQTFAELWPASTRRLVLVSSTGTSFGEEAGKAPPTWLADLDGLSDPLDPESTFMRDWWHVSMSVNPDFFSRKQRRDAAAMPARVWRAIAEQSLSGVDLREMLPRIGAPTLLIWGGRDTLASPAGRAALRAGIAHARVRDFDSLGHDLFWENPPMIAAVIADFLGPP
jgi:pimeloyl-ACP methyl ester carboxylesterase